MNKNNIKLVAVDLDGTLFNSGKKISETNKEAVLRAIDKGVVVVPATGRPFYGVPDIVKDIKGIEYVLTTNGAAVYRISDEACIFEEPMDTNIFLDFLRKVKQYFISTEIFIKGKAYTDNESVKVWEHMGVDMPTIEYIKTTRNIVDNLEKFIREDNKKVQKITINFAKAEDGGLKYRDEVVKLAEEYDEFVCVSGGMGNVELTKSTVNKGDSLIKLGSILGIKRENIMACGDSGNDKEMLLAAGLGVAMANSEPEILKIADYITLSNDEDGVAKALDKFCI